MSHYIRYYNDQIGGGGGVRNVYVGARYQRGHGIGAWLGGLLRRVLPHVASGAKAVGKEAARAGLNVLSDMTAGETSFKDSVKSRARESRKNLQRRAAEKISEMMKGSGYKRRSSQRKAQSRKKRGTVRTVRKKVIKKKKRPTTKNKKRKTTGKNKKKIKTSVRDIRDIFGPK